jgi:hypothetical protein
VDGRTSTLGGEITDLTVAMLISRVQQIQALPKRIRLEICQETHVVVLLVRANVRVQFFVVPKRIKLEHATKICK